MCTSIYMSTQHKLVMGDLDKAKEDLTEALKVEPNNKDIRRELTNLKAKEKQDLQRQRKVRGLCMGVWCVCDMAHIDKCDMTHSRV